MSSVLVLWVLMGGALGLALYGYHRAAQARALAELLGSEDAYPVRFYRAEAWGSYVTALVLVAFAGVIFWLDLWGVL